MSATPAGRASMLAAARAYPSLTRRSARLRAALAIAAAAAASVVALWMWGGVRPGPRPPVLMFLTSAGIALVALLVARTTLRRGRTMSGPSVGALALATCGGVLAMLAWKYGVSRLYGGMIDPWPERPGFRCLRLTIALGGVPLLATLLARRWTVAAHPGAAGAAMGATVGLTAMVGVDLWCPVAYLPHLLLGHVVPLAALAVLGAALGRRLLSPTAGRITPGR